MERGPGRRALGLEGSSRRQDLRHQWPQPAGTSEQARRQRSAGAQHRSQDGSRGPRDRRQAEHRQRRWHRDRCRQVHARHRSARQGHAGPGPKPQRLGGTQRRRARGPARLHVLRRGGRPPLGGPRRRHRPQRPDPRPDGRRLQGAAEQAIDERGHLGRGAAGGPGQQGPHARGSNPLRNQSGRDQHHDRAGGAGRQAARRAEPRDQSA